MRAPALALALALPVPAVAGGFEGPDAYGRAVPDCAVLAAFGEACVRSGRVDLIRANVKRGGIFHEVLRTQPRVEYVQGRRCPYPTRPSDSVLSGGSGYIIGNHVRADLGCAF